jgi:hypothetical protein
MKRIFGRCTLTTIIVLDVKQVGDSKVVITLEESSNHYIVHVFDMSNNEIKETNQESYHILKSGVLYSQMGDGDLIATDLQTKEKSIRG